MTVGRLRPLAVAVAFAYFVLVGGTDAGTVSLLRVVNGLLAAAVVGWWLWRAPREADRADVLVTMGLVAFLAAGMTALYRRPAFDAATAALGFAALYSVLRAELVDPVARGRLLSVLAAVNLILGVIFFSLYAATWSEWIRVAGSLPPLDLAVRVGFYRHYYLVALLLALTLPAHLAWLRVRRTRPLAVIGLALSAAVIVMSGSRTAWLAVGLGLLALPTWRLAMRRPRAVLTVAALAVAVTLVAAVAGAAQPVVERLLAGGTISLRGAIWGETLGGWLERPLLGHGPGSFPIVITLSGYFDAHPDVGRHADSALVQLAAEAGMIGLVGLALIGWGVMRAIRRGPSSPLRGVAVAGLTIFALACLTNDPSDSGSHVTVAIAWAAMAGPRLAPPRLRQPTPTRVAWRVGMGVTGAAVLIAWGVLQVAALRYDGARERAGEGDAAGARAALLDAVSLDPHEPLYRRELGMLALDADEVDEARFQLVVAAALNPADATALRALALTSAAAGEAVQARAWALRAVEIRPVHAINALTAAALVDEDGARPFLVEVLARDPWIGAAPSWAESFPTEEHLSTLLVQATEKTPAGQVAVATAWLAGIAGDAAPRDDASQAAAAMLACRLDEARALLAASDVREDISLLLLTVMAAQLSGHDAEAASAATLLALRYPPYGRLAAEQLAPANPLSDVGEDARLYRRAGLPGHRLLTVPTADEGLSAWLTDPAAAAIRGAPGSQLADCRGDASSPIGRFEARLPVPILRPA